MAQQPSERFRLSVIGQVVGASGLGVPGAHCRWDLKAGPAWSHVSGKLKGLSQNDYPVEGDLYQWQHPIDVVYEGENKHADWPHVEIEIRFRDVYHRSDLYGYAVAHVPATPGVHSIEASVWRPRGSFMDNFASFFIGGMPALRERELIFGHTDDERKGGAKLMRAFDKNELKTDGKGKVHLSLTVMTQRLSNDDQVQ